jgi:Zn-dependent peptidase ImmA (M78 family)
MSAEDQGRARAATFREQHNLGHAPLPDLVSLIELTQRIDVAVIEAEQDEHGMTMRDPVRQVVMLAVALTSHPMRQRSTLAHELGHVLFGDFAAPKDGGWDRRSPEEIRADAFARHLLVPIAGIKSVLADRDAGRTEDVRSGARGRRGPEKVSLPELSVLVQRFKASPGLVAIQLCGARLISTGQKNEWMTLSTPTLASRFGWSDLYQGWQHESQTRRAPQRLLSRAIEGYVANVVSLQAVARLRGLPEEQIAAELEEAGIIPAEVEAVPVPTAAERRPDTDFSELDALEESTGSAGDKAAPKAGRGAHGE